jgi:hypothetical protein
MNFRVDPEFMFQVDFVIYALSNLPQTKAESMSR